MFKYLKENVHIELQPDNLVILSVGEHCISITYQEYKNICESFDYINEMRKVGAKCIQK